MMQLDYIEQEISDRLTEVMTLFRALAGGESTRGDDLREVAFHIHALQNTVLANCAARYIDGFRTLGNLNYG